MTNQLGDMVRDMRTVRRMSQEELGEALGGKSRHWVVQLEKGVRYGTGTRFEVDGDMAVKIALVLGLDPVDVLKTAKIPENRWPDLSNIVSNGGNIRTIDVTTLTVNQADIIERLIAEFKAGKHHGSIASP